MHNQGLSRGYTNTQVQLAKPNLLIGEWINTKDEYSLALTMAEKRIGAFSREEMGQIVDVLANWRLMLGVTSDVTEHELVFITQFLYDNYKHLTLSDIHNAKNWSIMGKIEVGFVTQKTFSTYYISKCLNTYEDYKREIINEINRKKEQYERRKTIDNPTPVTSEQEANSLKDYLVALYESYKEGRDFLDIGDILYNWAKKLGLIKPDQKQVSDALDFAQKKIREIRYEDSKSLTSAMLYSGDEEQMKKKFARHYVICDMFEKHTLGELIAKIHPSQFEKK